jgi:hypothetical protein
MRRHSSRPTACVIPAQGNALGSWVPQSPCRLKACFIRPSLPAGLHRSQTWHLFKPYAASIPNIPFVEWHIVLSPKTM